MARNGPSVSHIFFADDLLLFLFGKATVTQMKALMLMELLNYFLSVKLRGNRKIPLNQRFMSPQIFQSVKQGR